MAITEEIDADEAGNGVEIPEVNEDRSPLLEDTFVWAENDEDYGSVTYTSPQGSKLWSPVCSEELKPAIGMTFESIKKALDFYASYGKACCFDVRSGSDKRTVDGSIIRKYIVCNKEGKNPNYYADSLRGSAGTSRVRKVPSIRTGCNARITLKRNGSEGFYVSQFQEAHNHSMASEVGSQFLKSRRQLNFLQQKVVVDLSKVNIGPVVAHKVYKGIAGSFANVGAQSRDFVNFNRQINSYIGDYDGQMVVEKLQKKKEVCSSFFFELYVEDGVLTRIFWADPICIRNYQLFGDVLSFDATYNLNKYRMIFIPFTGVDNNRRSVTFAAALVSSESKKSYRWVLEAFLKCMGKYPTVVVTDQDPSLRVVIPEMFPNAHHRFCMWHIMKKMSAKVGFCTPVAQEFRSKLEMLVYNEQIEIEEFELRWCQLVKDYNFDGNIWISNLFTLRHLWIPAFFRDVPMGGLLKTTSRSESQNSFFGSYLNIRMNLLSFMAGYECALESQRHRQALDEHDSLHKKSKLESPLAIELHARGIYTRSVFNDVQTEILASCFEVLVVHVKVVEKVKWFELKDNPFSARNVTVTHNEETDEFTCSCKKYSMFGFQCRHVFYALRSAKVDRIPERYVLNRWTISCVRLFDDGEGGVLKDQCQKLMVGNKQATILWSEINACLAVVGDDEGLMEELNSKVKDLRISLEAKSDGALNFVTRETVISNLIGATVPSELVIKSPEMVYTKGSGKRLVSQREIAIEKAKRMKKRCSVCKQSDHNKRTCPMKFANDLGGPSASNNICDLTVEEPEDLEDDLIEI